jgi:hypothetical protein
VDALEVLDAGALVEDDEAVRPTPATSWVALPEVVAAEEVWFSPAGVVVPPTALVLAVPVIASAADAELVVVEATAFCDTPEADAELCSEAADDVASAVVTVVVVVELGA